MEISSGRRQGGPSLPSDRHGQRTRAYYLHMNRQIGWVAPLPFEPPYSLFYSLVDPSEIWDIVSKTKCCREAVLTQTSIHWGLYSVPAYVSHLLDLVTTTSLTRHVVFTIELRGVVFVSVDRFKFLFFSFTSKISSWHLHSQPDSRNPVWNYHLKTYGPVRIPPFGLDISC